VTNTLTSYRIYATRIDAWLKSAGDRPQVAAAGKAYLEKIEEIKSIDEFLKNDRVFRYAMKAFGLEEMSYAKGFMRKVLEGGIDASNSFANQLVDNRYREFAATFNFARYGDTATVFDRTRQGTVDRYVRQSMEEAAGAQNEQVRLALYFERKAATIAGPFNILADKALTQVMFGALGLSQNTSLLNIDKQAELLRSRLDFADFQSPEKVAQFISRFAGFTDAHSTAYASTAGDLIAGAQRGGAIGVDLLLALQSARPGGASR
jgi:hypothetical protein